MKEINTNWYALYTKPRAEKKVSAALIQKGVVSFCPLYKDKRQWSDRIKAVELPLFKSYVFVKTHEIKLQEIKQVAGVVNFAQYLKKPALIKDSEIETTRMLIAKRDSYVAENKILQLNQLIKITSGLFFNGDGEIKEIGKNKIKLYLKSIEMLIELNTTNK